MPVKIKVEVILCPHQRCLSIARPGASWPLPAKLPVQLTRTGGGRADVVLLGETNARGVTKSTELERETYKVEIPGYDFEAAAELNLASATNGQTFSVRLAPRADRWLVVLQLTEYPAGTGLGGASMRITSPGGGFPAPPASTPDGLVYATAPAGPVTFDFDPVPVAGGGRIIPADPTVPYTVEESDIVEVIPFAYWPAIEISAVPSVRTPSGAVPLIGATVTVEYRGSPGVPGSVATKKLPQGASTVSWEYAFPGVYVITVTPPPDFGGLPIKAVPSVTTQALSSGQSLPVPAQFSLVATEKAEFRVQTPQNQSLKGNLLLEILGPGTVQQVTGSGASFTADIPANEVLKVRLDPATVPQITVPRIGDVPVTMPAQEQPVEAPPGKNTIVLDYLYSITAQVVDEHGRDVAGAMIDIVDEDQNPVDTVVADEHGGFVLGLQGGGTYYLAQHPQGGEVGIQERVDVHSNGRAVVTVQRGARGPGGPGPSPDGGPHGGEAISDLSAYPVLTEEISTTGAPTPSGGGLGGGAGAGYGQAVDQAIRDVLGWRPGGDLAGFQAALTGAFQLREREGHTEWKWQQRGYAVQADMGALTGAQASIYARAKAALDQIQPLLAGLITLNPSRYEPQDLETIRSVVGTELQELVSELSLEGGPRIQRVDQLFSLLLGKGRKSRGMNPDLVQGNLGTLRQRFALTVDQIQTVDEERVVTNFRIIVEQILALHASWDFDRKLLSAMSPRAAFGTVLIWLSRGLEAVCESVGDVMFALDSVYVDAAQRQVIELRFEDLVVPDVPQVPFRGNPPRTVSEPLGHQDPMFLSDLLDWVLRTSRDEGPRIIQDAGKDGVLAFKPVLSTLRLLVRATGQIARERNARNAMPAGMRTPRVDRAIKVLAAQLDEAANLASLVQVDEPPAIAYASILNPNTSLPVPPAGLGLLPAIQVMLTGSNFRGPARAVLATEDNESIADLKASATIYNPSSASAVFANPSTSTANAGTWQVSIINDDETQSNWIEVLRVPR